MSTHDAGIDKRVVLLQRLAAGPDEVLSPQSNLAAACGHTYEPARTLFDARPGEEIKQLEYLADLGYLERQFFDRIHLCICERRQFAINFREVCPHCASAHIDITDMIHHYACGYTGAEPEFQDGIRYVCPKCASELRHIGVDYEKVATNYVCTPCRHVFNEPDVSCRCLACAQIFGVERALVQTLHSYRLTSKGAVAAARGAIGGEASEGRLIDAELGVYSFSYFEERLVQEFAGAARYRRPLSIVALTLERLDDFEAAHGRQAAALVLRDFAALTRESLRDSDVAAVYDQTVLLLLLTDTSEAGARVAAERLRGFGARLNREGREPALGVSAAHASFESALSGPQALFELVLERLREARGPGGDRGSPAGAG